MRLARYKIADRLPCAARLGIGLRSATRQLDRMDDRRPSFSGLLTRVEIATSA
jgi:hypothetical protein